MRGTQAVGAAASAATVDADFRDAMNGFGFRLYDALSEKNETRNVFISPPSVELALSMTMNGAVGLTRAGMARTLGVEDMARDQMNADNSALLGVMRRADPRTELLVANSLWARKGIAFAPSFIARCRSSYDAEVRTVDFRSPAAAGAINAWVDARTKGRIKDLVDASAVRDALMVLANAVYFHGAWTLPFDPNDTKSDPFTLLDGSRVDVPLMRRSGDFRYLDTDQFQAAALPYGDRSISAYVFLPKSGVGLAALRQDLQRGDWRRWMARFGSRRGTVMLPRFMAHYTASLRHALSGLGMGQAFSDRADFSDMLAPGAAAALGGRAFISDVLHKTALEVNEHGTTAAAATGVIMRATAMPAERPFMLRVDRPFLFAIRHERTGLVLFLGTIVDPREG